MSNTNEHHPQVTQGSGSAENIGESREAQKNRNFDISDEQKQEIADQIGVKQSDIADPEDLGAGSGRDDLAGGFGDGMINQSTDEPTDVLAREDDIR
jgi:hypothetical protein